MIKQKKYFLPDFILCGSLIVGIFNPIAFSLIFVATILKVKNFPNKFDPIYFYLIASFFFGLLALVSKSLPTDSKFLFQHIFLWMVPLIFLLYRPSKETLNLLSIFVILLFIIDLSFNLYSFYFGTDFFNRPRDLREDSFFGRNGGVFGHSFYSGVISLCAFFFFQEKQYKKIWFSLPIFALLLCGSYRFLIIIGIVITLKLIGSRKLYVNWFWSIFLSAITIFFTIYNAWESDLVNANSMRVFAWISSIEKIFISPYFGYGYPIQSGLIGIDNYLIYDNNIAESWVLQSTLSFGFPYLIFRIIVYVKAINFIFKNNGRSLLFFSIAGEALFGGVIENTLFFIVFWLYFSYKKEQSKIL